ncbi:MAG TPA: tail fiber protein [Allosphingosinicella sp.]|jgi:microcystin-dependent protein
MSEPFLGEIKTFSYPDRIVRGYAACNGQQLPINQNQALFSLLGTMYGGNGQTTFALPNLQGRVPVHFGASFSSPGASGGEQAHTVTINEMPQHMHFLNTSNQTVAATAANATPNGSKYFAQGNASLQGGQTQTINMYGPAQNLVALAPNSVTNTGGSQPHNNMMPYLTISFQIALQGIFPSRN